MKHKRALVVQEETENHFWTAYSDLLAGMLFVFILLVVVMLNQYASFIEEKENRIDTQAGKLRSFHAVQLELTQELSKRLDQEKVRIDRDTGILRIDAEVLFAENEADLSPVGKETLARIFNAYSEVVLSERFTPFIEQVEIEGHTNSNGTYLYNLELSQRRAYSVMTFLLEQSGDNQERLQDMVVASGRSFSKLILNEAGEEDPVRSRRIEIRCRLREARLFAQIYRDLQE
ncbi:OmpA/MotB family protein [Acanthopleuribacter pedis]|uniref:OmpA family protein n=1 Tax=Acanthopleuribacter pedis TaxID=442870 RepID=A0A8J7QA78_9BACT|nr:OmpA family protein [Acanthopleuribacter pedis]MBO1317021.1 OmpA family protein [Acanthopleuribacter pedis]